MAIMTPVSGPGEGRPRPDRRVARLRRRIREVVQVAAARLLVDLAHLFGTWVRAHLKVA